MWQICIGMLQNVFPLLDANLQCGHLQKQNANQTLHFKSVKDLCKTSFCQLLQPNSFLSRIQQQLLAPKRIKRHPVITHASNYMKTGWRRVAFSDYSLNNGIGTSSRAVIKVNGCDPHCVPAEFLQDSQPHLPHPCSELPLFQIVDCSIQVCCDILLPKPTLTPWVDLSSAEFPHKCKHKGWLLPIKDGA